MEAILQELTARLELLRSERDQLIQQTMQMQANINAYNGAIQETERTVSLLVSYASKPDDAK
jgi:uncharacterized coiled-coil DUF342 family protein